LQSDGYSSTSPLSYTYLVRISLTFRRQPASSSSLAPYVGLAPFVGLAPHAHQRSMEARLAALAAPQLLKVYLAALVTIQEIEKETYINNI
jgi:hypothetical protein